MQMRNTDVDAVMDLGGSVAFSNILDTIRNNPYFDEERMNVPLMVVHSDLEFSPDLSLIDSLRYSRRYVCTLNNLRFTDFCTIGDIIRMAPDTAVASRSDADWGYEMVCRCAMWFFNAYLNGDDESMRYIDESPSGQGWDTELMSINVVAASLASCILPCAIRASA